MLSCCFQRHRRDRSCIRLEIPCLSCFPMPSSLLRHTGALFSMSLWVVHCFRTAFSLFGPPKCDVIVSKMRSHSSCARPSCGSFIHMKFISPTSFSSILFSFLPLSFSFACLTHVPLHSHSSHFFWFSSVLLSSVLRALSYAGSTPHQEPRYSALTSAASDFQQAPHSSHWHAHSKQPQGQLSADSLLSLFIGSCWNLSSLIGRVL